MLRYLLSLSVLILMGTCAVSATGLEIVHHDIKLTLHPEKGKIEAIDTLTCEVAEGEPLFFLLSGKITDIEVLSSGWLIRPVNQNVNKGHTGINAHLPDGAMPVTKYELQPPENTTGTCRIRLFYKGQITEDIVQQSQEYTRSFRETSGTVTDQGVYLAASSFWYPQANESLMTFRLQIHTPEKWQVITQGKEMTNQTEKGSRTTVWDCPHPMEEIYLVGGPLLRYEQKGVITSLVYLRSADPALAHKYLEATENYLTMYESLIGPYPYNKFALVENFWETGYGMPSFTLLGSRIIRFPFILRSSYPHEILHNWWGNGVFVDYQRGNWCEGLTAYLADHLLKEQFGQGAEYRRRVLQKYRDFVRGQEDFPLVEFRARHSPATEAVGYGKSLMLFHELRHKIGEEDFRKTLQTFYKRFLYQKASFFDIEKVCSEVTGKDLKEFFAQRVLVAGAPKLQLSQVNTTKKGKNYLVEFTLTQRGGTSPYQLQVPVLITMKNERLWHWLSLEKSKQSFQFTLEQAPLRLDIDPAFDVFRRLHRQEIPPSIGQIFGAPALWVVLSHQEDFAWQQMSKAAFASWGRGRANFRVVYDNKIQELPQDAAVWLIGKNNLWVEKLKKQWQERGVAWQSDSLQIQENNLSFAKHSIILTASHPKNSELAIGWVAGGPSEALPHLARKLPHYGKYSFLGFSKKSAQNFAKGQWEVVRSPMTHFFVSGAKRASLPKRKALAEMSSAIDSKNLRNHVEFLASKKLKGRGLGTPELELAAEYIADKFQEFGLKPGGDNNSYFQAWEEVTGDPSRSLRLRNVVGKVMGSDPELKNFPIVIGAHYDHLGLGWPDVKKDNKGQIHPGADDNASGVAVLLELARLFSAKMPKRTIIFVAFTGEEAGLLGSRHFLAQWPEEKHNNILAMMSLDAVGRLDNKLLILGTQTAREWPFLFYGCGAVTNVTVQSIATDLGSSDHRSFIDKGIPAVQIFSGAHQDFHTPGDTIDKIHFSGLTKVTSLMKEATEYLANREQPLDNKISDKPSPSPAPSPKKPKNSKRKTSLGSIPDFAYSGEGVRIKGVVPGSPAAKVGLQENDIITQLGQHQVQTLADLAHALASYQPGQTVTLYFKRQDKAQKVKVTLVQR